MMWKRTIAQPPPIKGAVVYPILYFDQAVPDQVVSVTMRFDDVLDPEQLRSSLSSLFEIGDWRKMGGRLRRNVSGEMEIHAPPEFTEEYPAIEFSHEVYPIDLGLHQLGRQMPQASSTPLLSPSGPRYRKFAAHPKAAASWEELITTGQPLIAVHVSSFEDCTLVALSWPHILFDAMGLRVLLESWSLVLAGREDEVPAILGARNDVLYEAADPKKNGEELKFVDFALAGWRMVVFAVIFIWTMIYDGKQKMNAIFMPAQAIAHLRQEAERDLEGLKGEVPFISDNDILMGWFAHLIMACQSPAPATILSVVNTKTRLPSVISSKAGEYVQNTVTTACCFLTKEEATGPFGRAALRHREEIIDQASEPQLLAHLRHARKRGEAGSDRKFARIGDVFGPLIVGSNWCKASLWNTVDFAPAVIKSSRKVDDLYPPGSMVYQDLQLLRDDPQARNVLLVSGKDREGNYWMTGSVADQVWRKIKSELERLTKELEARA